MNTLNFWGDVVSLLANLAALYFVIAIWTIVRSPSRAILIIAVGYMTVSRFLLLLSDAGRGVAFVESHRAIIIIPVYLLLALAFGMTYWELRTFRFDVPRDAEDRDTEAKHNQRMKDLSKPMKGRKDA